MEGDDEREREGSVFLPERFESEKTSPHHNGKLAAGRSHFPLGEKTSLLNIVQVLVTTCVATITFSQFSSVRRETQKQREQTTSCAHWKR